MLTARRDPYLPLLTTLLRAAGLGAGTALVLAGSACGGKVVVDLAGVGGSDSTTTGVGGVGGAPTTVSATSSGAGGSWPCDVGPPPDGEAVYHCPSTLAGPPCPASSSPEAFAAMAKDLNTPPPGEFCCEPGCAGFAVTQVTCGPDPTAKACCYEAFVTPQDWCMGRPFTVGAEARRAAPQARGDWRARTAACVPDVSLLEASTREALAQAWRGDALLEHASIASFARFVLDLLAIGAPADLVAEATCAIGDEVTHAEICFGLASAYAGEAVGPAPLSIDGALGGRTDPAEIVAAAVREGCVGETLAALAARAAADEARDPAVRAALTTIAADEERHAALAFRFVAWALSCGGAAREGALRALTEVVAGAGVSNASDDGESDASLEPRRQVGDLEAHGRLSPEEARRVMEQGLSRVVRPCAQALLAAAGDASSSRVSPSPSAGILAGA